MFNLFARPAGQSRPVAEVVAEVAAGRMALIDVRETAEIRASGLAKGAIHIPLGLIPTRTDPAAPDRPAALADGRPVALYCASGGRSGRAAQIMRQLGYAEVVNIGGLGDWVAAGGQVVSA
ncbi:MAG: rhodanese-like domain-containing protein [Rhodobacteraceae bacterium]|nr:rhodanese-like domain-containing protein [Paracoccaceae bacterium]